MSVSVGPARGQVSGDQHHPNHRGHQEEDTSSRALIPALAYTTGLLSLVTIVLSVTLHRTRLRPRIVRKRFISVAAPGSVERGNKKPKADTSGCGGLPVSDGLQLDIENCCNMSLCETVNRKL